MKPGGVFFITALLWLFLGAGGFFSDSLFTAWIITGLGLLPLILADALALVLFTDRLECSREVPSSLRLEKAAAVTIRIRRRGGLFPAKIALFDLYPESMESSAFPVFPDRRTLKNRGSLEFAYPLLPIARGPWEFSALELLLGSPLGFWLLKSVHPLTSRGRTYPDIRKPAEGALRGAAEKAGINTLRKRGQGLEFQSLRDYQNGDPVKNIDWRATSRRRKVIIREYQEEQDQQVLLLLDSGYRLYRRERSGREQGPSRRLQFDGALEAAMLLAYTALKHGDAVAAGTFGAEDRWFPPRKGISAFPELMNGLYDLKSAPVPSSPFSVLENALTRLRRRSFIILISNFREEDGESLSWILPRVEKDHLLLAVSLRELEVEGLAFGKPKTPEEELERAAAFAYLSSRRRLYKTWEHLGLLTLDTTSADLSSALINRYLEVKRSGRL
jgi:uncharacterized protein (DUF58 family)